jgi:subtilisin family serine protease
LDDVSRTARRELRATRGLVESQTEAVSGLLRAYPESLETDPSGWPVIRGEVLATAPSEAALAKAASAGFRILRDERLEGLDLRVVTLSPPAGASATEALRRLRRLDPEGEYDLNHLHLASGMIQSTRSSGGGSASAESGRVGLIDTGVNAGHPALTGARVEQRGFAGPVSPGGHGTAVASLLVGGAGVRGPAAGSELLAADVYGGRGFGGAADSVARALAWMAQRRVAVVNVSLVGPRNAVVAAAVRGLTAKGSLVVAAAGNGGPAAPPAYPAAYPGVIAVTGVDGRGRVLLEAGRGPHVSFAAPGADMAAAGVSGGYVAVRGTSFAAPLVAGLLARRLSAPDAAAGQRALRELETSARDLGSRGRDPVYGRGLVAEGFRTPPASVGALAAR